MPASRLLVVTPSLGGGGAERHLIRILPELTKHFDVHLALLRSGGALEADVPSVVAWHPVHRLGWWRAGWRLRRLLARLKPDVVLSVQEAANIPTLLAVRLTAGSARPPVVTSTQSAPSIVLADSRPRTRARMTRAIRRLYPLANRLIVASTGVSSDLVAIAPELESRTVVIFNAGVDPHIEALAAEECAHPFVRQQDVPVLVACGRLTAQKDYPTLLAAWARLKTTHAFRAVVLGDGPLLDPMIARAAALGLSDVVDFAGYVANPYPYMSRAFAFVLSSRSEGFGNVLAEALACGTPIVSTDCPHGPAEILDGGRYGCLVPPGDPNALAASLAALLDNPTEARIRAERGRARARTFSTARSAAEHVELLTSVVRRS